MNCTTPYMDENGESALDYWLDTVSADQAQIDQYLRNTGILTNKRILHVGVGQSSVASMFHEEFEHMDGIAIWKNEVKKGNDLGYLNYKCYVADKYMLDQLTMLGDYDIIIDNNIRSYQCCDKHYEDWIGWMLDNSSTIVTHELGMRSRKEITESDIDRAGGLYNSVGNGVVLIT